MRLVINHFVVLGRVKDAGELIQIQRDWAAPIRAAADQSLAVKLDVAIERRLNAATGKLC